MVFLKSSGVSPDDTSIIRDRGNMVLDGVKNRLWIGDGVIHAEINAGDDAVVDSKYILDCRRQMKILNPNGTLPCVSPLIKTVTPTAKAWVEIAKMFRDPQISALAFYIDKNDDSRSLEDQISERFDILNICMVNPFLPVRVFRTMSEALEFAERHVPEVDGRERALNLFVDKDGFITFERNTKYSITPRTLDDIISQLKTLEELHPDKALSRLIYMEGLKWFSPSVMLGGWDKEGLYSLKQTPIAIVTGGTASAVMLQFISKYFSNRPVSFFDDVEDARDWLRYIEISLGLRDEELAAIDSADSSA